MMFRAIAQITTLLVILVVGIANAETSLTLTTGNDLLGGNEFDDDLYTAALGTRVHFGRFDIELEERMFTDRAADLRFDETWLVAGYRPRRAKQYRLVVDAGLVHTGRGLFGESVQNAVHRAIGTDEVDLEYIDADSYYPVLGFAASREVWGVRRVAVEVHAEARAAFGFQYHARAGLRSTWQPSRWFDMYASLGARLGGTEMDALEPWIEDIDYTAELGVGLLNRLYLSWSHNQYGTGAGHLHLGYRVPLPAGGGVKDVDRRGR